MLLNIQYMIFSQFYETFKQIVMLRCILVSFAIFLCNLQTKAKHEIIYLKLEYSGSFFDVYVIYLHKKYLTLN